MKIQERIQEDKTLVKEKERCSKKKKKSEGFKDK